MAHEKQTGVYGEPKLVVSDQGSQLKGAAKDLINWDNVAHQTAPRGTTWQFTPAGCPWRNGASERAIGLVKKTLLKCWGPRPS